jgi:hypothetical protein
MKNWPRKVWFYLGAAYLVFQSFTAVIWWVSLLIWPNIRPYFRPTNTPDSALFAFLFPDLILFIFAALVSAKHLITSPHDARTPLLLHFGGAAYASIYCISQTLLTGEAILATLFMLPPVFAAAVLLWLIGRK